MVSTTILAIAYVVCRIASVPWAVVSSLDVPRVPLDGEPMGSAVLVDKVASALGSFFLTSFAEDLEAVAGTSAGALYLRK